MVQPYQTTININKTRSIMQKETLN